MGDVGKLAARLGPVSVSVGGHPDASLAASRVRFRARGMISIHEIEFRTVRPHDPGEYRAYMRMFWDVQTDLESGPRRSDAWLDSWIEAVRAHENHRNTRNGVALHDGRIVGLYVLRAHEAFGCLGAHVTCVWVHEDYRQIGVEAQLRQEAEAWARAIGAELFDYR